MLATCTLAIRMFILYFLKLCVSNAFYAILKSIHSLQLVAKIALLDFARKLRRQNLQKSWRTLANFPLVLEPTF